MSGMKPLWVKFAGKYPEIAKNDPDFGKKINDYEAVYPALLGEGRNYAAVKIGALISAAEKLIAGFAKFEAAAAKNNEAAAALASVRSQAGYPRQKTTETAQKIMDAAKKIPKVN